MKETQTHKANEEMNLRQAAVVAGLGYVLTRPVSSSNFSSTTNRRPAFYALATDNRMADPRSV